MNDQPQFIDRTTLRSALRDLKGTADHLLKIWLTLKHMGMREGVPVKIDTANSTPSLKALFGYGAPDGRLFVPFAHTTRYMTMASDASRSIIQTTIRRWATSGSVVTVDPTSFLSIDEDSQGHLTVRPARSYPEGLGYGRNGFALESDARVSVPITAFAVWLHRQTPLPQSGTAVHHLVRTLTEDLHLSAAERQLVFTDDLDRSISTSSEPLSDYELYEICQSVAEGDTEPASTVHETYDQYIMEVRSMVTPSHGRPEWLTGDPADLLKDVLDSGEKAVLIYGPPRTGKTRILDVVLKGKHKEHIQIHNGWGYSELILGLKPRTSEGWEYREGPLLKAIRGRQEVVVLEEINRTDFSQAIGEIFSLIEPAYRGEEHALTLQDGSALYVPQDTLFLFTMNTLDRSTENIDDALFGRMAAVEFPPRVEVLTEMLEAAKVPRAQQWREFFAAVQSHHPLGHGYFATLTKSVDPFVYYRTRIRPVLQKHLAGYRDDDLRMLDEKFNDLFE